MPCSFGIPALVGSLFFLPRILVGGCAVARAKSAGSAVSTAGAGRLAFLFFDYLVYDNRDEKHCYYCRNYNRDNGFFCHSF